MNFATPVVAAERAREGRFLRAERRPQASIRLWSLRRFASTFMNHSIRAPYIRVGYEGQDMGFQDYSTLELLPLLHTFSLDDIFSR